VAKEKKQDAEEEGGEFAEFLADVSKEIAQRVESLDPRATPKAVEKKKTPIVAGTGVIVEWPNVAERMIEEMR
jgi:hypothetical protein